MAKKKTNLILDEDHYIVHNLLHSSKIDDLTRLTALAEINHLENSDKLWPYAEAAHDVDDLFEWHNSELGADFWSDIQDTVFESEKRTC